MGVAAKSSVPWESALMRREVKAISHLTPASILPIIPDDAVWHKWLPLTQTLAEQDI